MCVKIPQPKREVTRTREGPSAPPFKSGETGGGEKKTRTNVRRPLVRALLTFSMAFGKHPKKPKETKNSALEETCVP